LEDAKLWQQGNYKAYYTGLSDITRTFIQNRWSVAAMEMTTDEILRMQIIAAQSPDVLNQLKNMLELADLVKFAKAIPVLHENEQSIRSAVAFVKANQPFEAAKEVTA
jgi:acetolactate synthase small subunit